MGYIYIYIDGGGLVDTAETMLQMKWPSSSSSLSRLHSMYTQNSLNSVAMESPRFVCKKKPTKLHHFRTQQNPCI